MNKPWVDRFVNYLCNQKSINSDNTMGKYFKNLITALMSDLTDFNDKAVFRYRIPKAEV